MDLCYRATCKGMPLGGGEAPTLTLLGSIPSVPALTTE